MFPLKDLDGPIATPVATGIAAVTTLAFLWQLTLSGSALLTGTHDQSAQTLFANYGFTPQNPQWHTIATYPLLHVSALHLAANILFIHLFGPALEARTGPLRFLALYLLSAAAAALLYLLVFPASPNPLAGASGAVSGVTAAYALTCPRNRITVLTPTLQTAAVPAIFLIAAWVLWQIAQPLAFNQPPTAITAHAGGAAAGAVLAIAATRAGVLRP